MSKRKSRPFALEPAQWAAPFFLAPVAGYSDAAFRAICSEMGASLCYTEMVSSEALVRGHKKTKELLDKDLLETRYAIQLFGANPSTLAKAVELVSLYAPAVIDLNCGCPVPKIIKAGAGSALLTNPKRIGEIVRAMKGATSIPISVKLRTGWDSASINYLECAAEAIEAGACAITLHGRTRAQGYSGKADWNAIKTLAENSSVPVFGSGDVVNAQAARQMLDETQCDAVMIARGALGNPFIFQELRRSSQTEPKHFECVDSQPTSKISETILRHLSLAIQHLGEKNACLEFRKHFCAYTKGISGGAAFRARAVHCSSLMEYQQLLSELESPDKKISPKD